VVAVPSQIKYFASLVPNTAMAKEASLSNWSQGVHYLADFVGPYLLVLPLALLAGLWWVQLEGRSGTAARRFTLLAAVVAGSGAVHALYVVKVGGDFMHARLLLPAWFVVLLPVSVVVARGAARVVALTVAVWVVATVVVLRPPYSRPATRTGDQAALQALERRGGIGDERLYYTRNASSAHPVTIDDYLRHSAWAKSGAVIRRVAARAGHPVLVLRAMSAEPIVVPLRRGSAPRSVASADNLGLFGYAAGNGLDVIDDHGLADVVAGRQRLRVRGRPGHEKVLPDVWTFARYATPGTPLPEGMTATQVAAARHALSCGDLHSLLDATTGAWSAGDSPSNLVEAVRSFRFRFDPDPLVAEREVCGA